MKSVFLKLKKNILLTFAIEIILCSVLITGAISCSSDGKKSDSAKSSSSSKKSEGEDTPSQEEWSGSANNKTESKPSDAGPTKKDLYDQIQISLGSNDDGVVEKSVATFLSQDQGDAKALNALALYHLSKNRTHLARMIFKSILAKDPKNAAALNNLGVIYSQQGEEKSAIDSFRKAVDASPKYPIASANLGAIFAAGKDYGKARGFLENAYKGGIKDLSVLNNYAIALMDAGDNEAADIFKEALQIGASDVIVSFNYALYLTYTKKDFKSAGEILDKIRFMGVPPGKKSLLSKMEETISGRTAEESKH